MEIDEKQDESEGHVPWAALQAWYQGLEPGSGLTKKAVEVHFEICKICQDTLGDIVYNLQLDKESWDAEFKNWRQTLGGRSPVAELSSRVEVDRFWGFLRHKRDEFENIRANPNEEERNAALGKLLAELHTPEVVLMMEIHLGGVPELWKQSREIANTQDEVVKLRKAEELANACRRLFVEDQSDSKFTLQSAKHHPDVPIPLNQPAVAYLVCSAAKVHMSSAESLQVTEKGYLVQHLADPLEALASRQTPVPTGSLGGRGSRLS